MKQSLQAAVVLGTVALTALGIGSVLAQSAAPATTVKIGEASLTGNSQNGEALYIRSCLSCHNRDGQAYIPQYPRLSRQLAAYTAEQLADFKSGKRQNAVMSPVAAQLSNQDMADLSVYLAGVANAEPYVSQNADLRKKGEELYARCAGCHGAQGEGNPQTGFPHLAGQNQAYFQSRIKELAADPNGGPMSQIAKALSPEETLALSEFVKTLK